MLHRSSDRSVRWCASPTRHTMLGVAVAASVVADTARRARSLRVGPREERVFRWFNDRSDRFELPAWVIMQAGSIGAVATVTAALARRRRCREAALVGTVGGAVWWGVRSAKPSIGRGRPSACLERAVIRGRPQTGLGYPSGHAAVAASLAGLTIGSRCRAGTAAAIGAAGLVGATRIYVGAHLPLDVVGGLAVGSLAAGAGRRIHDRVGS